MKALGLALLLLLAFPRPAQAEPTFAERCAIGLLPPIACAYIVAEELKPGIERIRGAWDKFKHCALSCQIGLICPPTDTLLLGLAKEIVDVFGPGNAEWADLKADHYGTMLSVQPSVRSNEQCNRGCAKRYPLRN